MEQKRKFLDIQDTTRMSGYFLSDEKGQKKTVLKDFHRYLAIK